MSSFNTAARNFSERIARQENKIKVLEEILAEEKSKLNCDKEFSKRVLASMFRHEYGEEPVQNIKRAEDVELFCRDFFHVFGEWHSEGEKEVLKAAVSLSAFIFPENERSIPHLVGKLKDYQEGKISLIEGHRKETIMGIKYSAEEDIEYAILRSNKAVRLIERLNKEVSAKAGGANLEIFIPLFEKIKYVYGDVKPIRED